MATKRRRRRSTKRRARRNPVTAVVRHNPSHRRRRYRRNPPFSVGGVVGRVTDAGKGALFMVAGEGATRFVRKDLFNLADGQTVSNLADAGIGIGLGMAAERFIGRQAGRDLTAGVFAYLLRDVAKRLGIAKISEVLGDAGGVRRFVVGPGGKVSQLNGYVGRGSGRPLSGYVGRGNGNAVQDEAALGLR